MWHRPTLLPILVVVASIALATETRAQSLGTFRWQLEPHCNIVSVTVTPTGGVFRLEGTDDQCGGGSDFASAIGTAFLNPDGSVGIGLSIIATPGGAPVHVDATISVSSLGGTWRDSAGNTGNFVFRTGSGSGGSPRPSSSGIPSTITLLSDGGFLAGGTFGQGTIPTVDPGTRMMWHPRKAAFRVGRVTGTQWDESSIGEYSIAAGLDTIASHEGSVAFGRSTEASGIRSVAYGFLSKATAPHALAGGFSADSTGFGSVALGDGVAASANSAVALGFQSVASGRASFAAGEKSSAAGSGSVAMGIESEANNTGSVAIGRDVQAIGGQAVVLGSSARSLVNGAFVFGDASVGGGVVFAPVQNSFTVRAAGGYTLFTNSSLTTGATLAPGGSGWGIVSDANMKENFRDLDTDDVLSKIARMPVREWNYKTQDAAIRHVGPTAQDFHAAFGLGEDPLRINTIDADGIALRAIQALEARTRELMQENAALKARLDRLEAKRP